VGRGFSKVATEEPRSERMEPGGNLGVFSSSGILGCVGVQMVDPAIEERTWELASTRYCEQSVVFWRGSFPWFVRGSNGIQRVGPGSG
jgi:hypothetical protein